MKQFNPKLINFKMVLTLSLLTMSAGCPGKKKVQQQIIDQYRAWKNNNRKDRLEEKDQKEMVKKFKDAIDQVDTKLNKNGSSSIGPLLKWLNMYTEEVKRKFFSLEAYNGYTLLGYAIVKNSDSIVKELLEEPSIKLNKPLYKGEITGPLQLAISKKLPDYDKTKSFYEETRDSNEAMVLPLLKSRRYNELDFECPIPKTTNTTILHVAVEKLYSAVVEELIKRREKIESILNKECSSQQSKTAFNIAISNYLGYYGALKDENEKFEKTESIMIQRKIIRDLLKLDTLDLNLVDANDGVKFIDREATNQKDDLIKLLANHKNFMSSSIYKALQEYRCPDNNGPQDGLLHKAVRDKILHKVRMLTTYFPGLINLQNGQEKNNDTTLHIAVSNDKVKSGDIVIVEELLKVKDIDVNIKNNSGDTPLHFAAYCESEAIAQILVNNLANKTIQNNDGLTPYGIVEQRIQRSNRSWGLNKPVLKVLYPDKN